MMKAIKVLSFIFAVMVVSGVIAQALIPYSHWPSLYKASKEMVVKRGTDRLGELNNKLYFRIGWGECLSIRTAEWQELINATQTDRYINMRAYADSKYSYDWNDEDGYNCPRPPLELKPTWRGSRPVYYKEYDADLALWTRTTKSPYRILAPDPSVTACNPYNAKKVDGSKTNYWNLPDTAEVYRNEETFTVESLNVPGKVLVSVCRNQDVSVEDYRW